LPLAGLRVVEMGQLIAGPFVGKTLGDFGAEVIKIEPPQGGDPLRTWRLMQDGTSVWWQVQSRNKRSVAFDLKDAAAQDIVRQLAQQADVLIENFRPGAMEGWGLGPDDLLKLNPSLIMLRISGYGQTGPWVGRRAYAPVVGAEAGLTRAQGDARGPVEHDGGAHYANDPHSHGDVYTSLEAAAGILAALYERERTGEGRVVEASLLRTASFAIGVDLAIVMSFGRVASNRPRKGAVQPLANFFRTKDDRWICLVPRQTGDEWKALRGALGLEHLADDPRFKSAKDRRLNAEPLVEAIDAGFAQFTFAEATARLDAANLVWAPMQTAAEAVKDPQLHAAGGIVQTPSGPMPASPVRFHGVDQSTRGPAPGPSEHARGALADYGFSVSEIEALIASGAVKAS